MRLLPESLFGRLVLVLLAGLALAQAATLYINQTERDQLLYRAGGMHVARQIADIVKLLESLPPPERQRVAAVFNAPPIVVSLDRPALAPREDSSATDVQLAMFTSVLRHSLGEGAKVAVVRLKAPPAPPPRAAEAFSPPGMMGNSHRMHGDHMAGPMMMGFGPGAPAFTVQVGLRDGSLVTVDSSVARAVESTTLRLALTLAVLLGTVVALSLVAVRWVTRPLSVLAGAAEALGENIDRPPLAETGPIEARRAARSFNAMQQRLSRSMAERTRVLAAMSHDLRTPITRMRLRTEMLEDESLREKFDHDLGEMEQMVTQTLEFMRDAGGGERVQSVDLTALLESLQSDYEDMGKPFEVVGRVRQPIPGRPAALRRCLANLIENALRYGGSAKVEVEDAETRITLRILDEGPGIPEKDLEGAFEPFYRGDASRNRDEGGFGLGLGIARNIAQAHGGGLVLRNRPTGGLEATLTLARS